MAFPTIVTTSSGSDNTQASHSVTLPTGIATGDLIIVVFAQRQTTALTWPAGWTQIVASGTNIVQARYKVADGSEGASITITPTNTASASWVAYRITGYDGTALVEGTASASSGATPDPTSLTPTGGAKDYLWICTASLNDGTSSQTFSAAPTNYGSLLQSGAVDASTNGSRTGAAVRNLNAASDDPGVFTLSAGTPTSRCVTLAVHPSVDTDTEPLTGVSSAGAVGDLEPSGGTPTHLTTVGISGTQFTINGVVTHPGTPAEGLLINSRMINAIADDENGATVVNWEYTDTSEWDAQRNTDEFCAMLPTYADAGLRLITVGLMGGWAGYGASGDDQASITLAFNADGSTKSAWFDRLDQVITAADTVGIIVLVQVFYYGQDQRLTDDTAAQAALDNTVDWLVAGGYTNVLLEVANESYQGHYDRLGLDTLATVIDAVESAQTRSGGTLKVSSSPVATYTPNTFDVGAFDFVLIHGNGRSVAQLETTIAAIKATAAYIATPKPIMVNEDSTDLSKMTAAIQAGASWGYYDQAGFQTMPVSWAIDTSAKEDFFDAVTTATSEPARPPMLLTFWQ